MITPVPARRGPSHGSGKELDRLVFFSDAIFAIAMTLPALEVRLPEMSYPEARARLPQELLGLIPKLMSMISSFFVVGIYWTAHHRIFQWIRRIDDGLIWWNLGLLFTICLVPVTAAILGSHGWSRAAVVIYALNMCLVSLVHAQLWRHASGGHRLVDPDLPPGVIRNAWYRSIVPAGMFLCTAGIALIQPHVAEASLMLLIFTRRIAQRIAPMPT